MTLQFVRTLAFGPVAAMLIACSVGAAQDQSVTRIEATPVPQCPTASLGGARQSDETVIQFSAEPAPNEFALHLSRALPESAIAANLFRQGTSAPSGALRTLGNSLFPPALQGPCRRDDGGVTYRYAIDDHNLQPGMYELHAHGTGNQNVRGETTRLYLGKHQPVALPLRIGQRYLVLPPMRDDTGVSSNIVYVDDSGRVVPPNAILLHVARITSLSPTTITLAVDDTPYHLRESRRNEPYLIGLAPLLEDRSQRAMDSWYAGKRAWTRGQLQGLCANQSGVTNAYWSPVVQVRHVYRVAVPFFELALGHNVGGSGFGRDSGFETSSPLLAVLTVEASPTPTFACSTSFSLFADAWDMQRALSIISAREAHPGWPAEVLAAIDEKRARVGMTHEMVAWALGYPPDARPTSTLDRLSGWLYDDGPKLNLYVDFDDSGRVTDFGRTTDR